MSLDLFELSEARAELPKFGPVGGDGMPTSPLATQIRIGRAEAGAILKQYVGDDFRYSRDAARQVLHSTGAWIESNEEQLTAAMKSSELELPDALRLTLGPKNTAQYVLASYTIAGGGSGAWEAGLVGPAVNTPGVWPSEPQAREDADARIAVFATIKKMEADGDLAQVFGSAQGLGLLPVLTAYGGKVLVTALVVVLVATAALVVYWSLNVRKLEASERLMAKLCADAKGSQFEQCLCAAQGGNWEKSLLGGSCEGKKAFTVDPAGDVTDALVKVATTLAVVGGVYAAVIYGAPEVARIYREQRDDAEQA